MRVYFLVVAVCFVLLVFPQLLMPWFSQQMMPWLSSHQSSGYHEALFRYVRVGICLVTALGFAVAALRSDRIKAQGRGKGTVLLMTGLLLVVLSLLVVIWSLPSAMPYYTGGSCSMALLPLMATVVLTAPAWIAGFALMIAGAVSILRSRSRSGPEA